MRRHHAVHAALGAMVLATSLMASLPVQAASRCSGRTATIVGTSRNDRINGTPAADVIVTGSGADRINAGAGNDVICSGNARDRVRGQAGNDRVFGGNSGDVLHGSDGDDQLFGGQGADFMHAGKGNDVMNASSGADFMLGVEGNDQFLGGEGLQDLMSFEDSEVGVTVDLGVSTAQNTNEGTDVVTGVEGAIGSFDDDVLKGANVSGEFGDLLAGLEGTDQLLGFDGNDFIVGGGGSDRGAPAPGSLWGGLGNDFVFGDEPEFPEGAGDDDLFGDAGDDYLDGGGNISGPPAGDVGNGGTHVAGDQCTALETATECERFLRNSGRTLMTPAHVEAMTDWWMGATWGRLGPA